MKMKNKIVNKLCCRRISQMGQMVMEWGWVQMWEWTMDQVAVMLTNLNLVVKNVVAQVPRDVHDAKSSDIGYSLKLTFYFIIWIFVDFYRNVVTNLNVVLSFSFSALQSAWLRIGDGINITALQGMWVQLQQKHLIQM